MNYINNSYIESVTNQFEYYKMIGEKTFVQVTDEQMFWQPNRLSNSIAILVKHLNGTMLSRWTDFLLTDGEKSWRQRDAEFEIDFTNRQELLLLWSEGWKCVFKTLNELTEKDLQKNVFIRNQELTVIDAINRQLAHYCYHIGQIFFIGKALNSQWNCLSIAKKDSLKNS